MILVYSNKPFLSRLFKEHLLDSLAEEYHEETIFLIHQLLFTNLNFNYPKNITWKNYPYIQKPEYKIEKDLKKWMPIKLDLSKKNQREKIITENFDNVTWNDVKNVKEIIFLADISKTEIHDFKVFSDIVFDEEKMEQNKKEIKRSVVILTSLDKASIKNAWDQRIEVNKDFEEYQEDIKKENIKDYFDFNFNINSMGILGATLKLSGVDQNKFFLSKYTLQFLYKLQEMDKPRTEGELISVMHKWKGTGKYENKVGLGTEVSRSEIISSICNSGLLHINGNQIVKTDKLNVLLANLHKDCKDLDLPFRIHNWKEEDYVSAVSKINTYMENKKEDWKYSRNKN